MKTKIILGLIVALTLVAASSSAQEFTLTTTSANTMSSKSTIDLPGLSGNPLAIIVATPVSDTAKLNPHPIGAWYYSGKWNIFNTDHAVMPMGAKYRVQYFPQPGPNQFLHVITRQNLSDEGSQIDNPAFNNNPNAQIKILQNYAPDNRSGYYLNKFEAKAGYNSASGKWYVKNVNDKPLSPNTAYNIVISSDGTRGLNVPQTSRTPTPTPTPVTTATPTIPTAPQSPMPTSTGPCTKETAYQTPGKWARQKNDDLAMADRTFPKEQYKPVLAKAQKVIPLLMQANPEFKGIQASASLGIRGDSYFPNGALPFRVDAAYDAYICVGNDTYIVEARGKVLLNGNVHPVIVYFNSFGWALESIEGEGQFLTANGEALFYMPKQLGDFKGMTLLQPDRVRSEEKQEAVIITPNARLPYKPVTREQFIQARIKYYREFFQTLRRSSFEPVIAELNLLLANMSPAERQTQAIVRDPFENKERLFVTEARGGKRVVAIDKDFFNPKLQREAIQFIVVYWSWDDKHPSRVEMIRQFKQNFDFEALRQMLGK